MTDHTDRVPRVDVLEDGDPLFADLIGAVRATLAAGQVASSHGDPVLTIVIGRPGRHRLDEAGRRGRLVVWTGEPLPPRAAAGTGHTSRLLVPHWRGVGPRAASVLRATPLPGPFNARRVRFLTARLLETNLRELRQARDAGAMIVVTSRDRMLRLADDGIDARVVPFGYHPIHAGPLTGPGEGARDQPMLLLGSAAAHTRRASSLALLTKSAGADLLVSNWSWGAERSALLRRSRVVVDIHRVQGNFVGLRLVLALAAGAVVVTEPMSDPFPFVPGAHFVEAPLVDLVAAARGLLADEERRRAIVDAGQQLLTTDLSMGTSVARLMAVATADPGASP